MKRGGVIETMYMILVDPKVFSFVVKWVQVIFLGFKEDGGYYKILWES
jgi:hypothetical protein